ncbi:MAG: hypothetical protein IJV01_04765 [Bacteroidales bacterium]|nr:hypothetical protein [Bacteroidales bacterium]
MMKAYQQERARKKQVSTVAGVLLTLLVHGGALAVVSFTGLKYIWPPPPEDTFLIDFEQEEQEQFKLKYGPRARGEDVDREKPVEMVQRSESPHVSTAQNLAPKATPDAFGDVETPAPKEPEINKNALFPGMSSKDTSLTTPHAASEATPEFKAGEARGNADNGPAEGKPNAHLEGRKIKEATLQRPNYNLQESGKVVVKIWVDNYGNVVRAQPGADGTTVPANAKLWAEVRKTAMEAKFNMKADAPALQEGTITYNFKLK